MRLRSRKIVANQRPFAASSRGASLYVGAGSPDPGPASVVFRRLRLLRGPWTKGSGFDFGNGLKKIAAVAQVSDPTHVFNYTLPSSLHGKTVYLQVRTWADNVENTGNYAPYRVVLDSSGADVTGILGTAVFLGYELRDGGVVRLKFQYLAAADGLQPQTFRARRTAGPSSPSDATAAYDPRERIQTIDTPALLDSSAYTYKITAINGATTLDVLTGISIQADATGPSAPTGGSAVAW